MTFDPDDLAALAAELRAAASALISALDSRQRELALAPFDEEELRRWTYLPGPRPGLLVRELTTEQRGLASRLLVLCFSGRGATDAESVVRTEAIRSGQDLHSAPDSLLSSYADPQYYLRLLGDPRRSHGPWMWRLSGHHLVAQAIVIDDDVSTTPQFFGAQPAHVLSGEHAGFRGLAREEDFARQLVTLLGEDQRHQAILSAQAPDDILTRHDPVATARSTAHGLPHARMDTPQRQLFEALIRQYLDRAPGPVADRAWVDLHQAGLGNVTFGWAGGILPGDGHYYAVAGQTLLLEYDNTQEDANHIHSVWRDLRHDWGGDLLRAHYQRHSHADQSAASTS